MRRILRRMIAGATSLSVVVAPLAVRANPLNGTVAAGNATVAGEGTATVTVTQTSPRTIIDWRSFNIALGETTQFNQPNAASVILNRVTGGLGASTINGMIKANGGVYVVNPDGILFGPSAVVNTGSFLATTHDIRNDDFMAGRYNFTISGNPTASIVNQGTITAASGGFASLVAPGVRNDGVITARLGTVTLASGNGFTLDLYGDSLIKLQPSDVIAAQVRDVATGLPLASLVSNTGKLKANGGTVVLSAAATRLIVDSVINTSGVVQANTVGTHGGRVIFGAATAGARPADAPPQVVKVSGKINAVGKKPGTKGGIVQITGEDIQLSNVTINASGNAGGGTILIGGDYRGGNPDPSLLSQYGISLQPWTIPTATTVTADASVTLNASALSSGNGGKVVVWSDQTTAFNGSIFSKGGSASGNGGFVEVSGAQQLSFNGNVDTTAPNGKAGTVLFDPGDLYIVDDTFTERNFFQSLGSTTYVDTGTSPAPGDSVIRATRINALLLTTDVFIQSTFGNIFVNAPIIGPPNSHGLTLFNTSNPILDIDPVINIRPAVGLNGNIFINAPIIWNGTGTLSLLANNSIFMSPGNYISVPIASGGGVGLDVGNGISPGTIGTPSNPVVFVVPSAPGQPRVDIGTLAPCSGAACGVSVQYHNDPNNPTAGPYGVGLGNLVPASQSNINPLGSTFYVLFTLTPPLPGQAPLPPPPDVTLTPATPTPVPPTSPVTVTPTPTNPTVVTPTTPASPLSVADQQALLSQYLGDTYAYLTNPDGAPSLFDLFGSTTSSQWSITSRPSDSAVLPDWQAYWNSPAYQQSEQEFISATQQQRQGNQNSDSQTNSFIDASSDVLIDKTADWLRGNGDITLGNSITAAKLVLDYGQSAYDIGQAASVDANSDSGGKYTAVALLEPVLVSWGQVFEKANLTVNVMSPVFGGPQGGNTKLAAEFTYVNFLIERIHESIQPPR